MGSGQHPQRSHMEAEAAMDWTLELVIVPVSDIDRAKAFYMDRIGFVLDVDP